MKQQPAHRVVQMAVIEWANGLNGKAPVGEDVAQLIANLTGEIDRDREVGRTVTIVAPTIPLILQREWMAQALFEVDAPEHRDWEDAWLDERERYLALADVAIRKAAALGLSS